MSVRACKRGKTVSAFGAWDEIVARLRAARRRAIFLDFDGTLVKIQRSPRVVRSSSRVNRILESLIRNSSVSTVAIVSGRRTSDLRRLLPVRGLRYFGLHGGERDGASVKLREASRRSLSRAKQDAHEQLEGLRGIWIEDKRFSFCVHYRQADQATAAHAERLLRRVLAPWRKALHVLNGKKTWEALPPEIPGKFAAVEDALAKMPSGAAAIYIGDDETDEGVFAALRNQATIRVGRADGTRARYFLPAPSDVLRFLARLDRELRRDAARRR